MPIIPIVTHLILALGIVRKPTVLGFYYFTKPLAYMPLAGLSMPPLAAYVYMDLHSA